MTFELYEKIQTHILAVQFTGGREQAIEICKAIGRGSSYIPPTKADAQEYIVFPSLLGERRLAVGEWLVQLADEQFISYRNEAFVAEYAKPIPDEDHRLIRHARHELDLLVNEEADFKESIMKTIKGFTSYRGHSGSSAAMAIHMVNDLLQNKNLLPLTSDPDEWILHEGKQYGVDYDLWQNKRNLQAISKDGGKTFYLTGEMEGQDEVKYYNSAPPGGIAPEIEDEIDPLEVDRRIEEGEDPLEVLNDYEASKKEKIDGTDGNLS